MNETVKTGIRWGIIGCGNVTEVKSGPAFNKISNSSLIAVMRRDAARAKDYAERHKVPRYYDNADLLINDPDINAVYVATPPGSHEAYAIAAMKAGKSVYVEKPMAIDVNACLRMKDFAEKTNSKLTIAHYRRALPKFLYIRDLLKTGAIGIVRTVRISMLQKDKSSMIAQPENNWRVDPAIAGAGLFYDLAPHQLDLVMYFFGKPLEATGISANQAGLYDAEDVVTGIMRLPNNILFTGQWCYTVGEGLDEDLFEIVGSKGKISFTVFGHEVLVHDGTTGKTVTFEPPAHIQQPLITKIVNYFLDAGSNPCSADDAIESMKVMEVFAYGSRT